MLSQHIKMHGEVASQSSILAIYELIRNVTNFLFKSGPTGTISLGILYYLFGQFGLLIQSSQSGLTLIWPASGIAFAVLYLYRIKLWPGIFLGMFFLAIHNQIPLPVALLAAMGSVLEAVVGIYLLQKIFPETTIDRLNGLLAFTFFCVLIGPLFSAFFGTYALHVYLDPPTRPMVTWLYWWLGNSIGLMTFGGALVAYTIKTGSHGYRVGLFKEYQFPRAVLYLVVIAISLANAAFPDDPLSMVLLFFALPAVALIGLTGGIRSAAHVNLMVVTIFILGGYTLSAEHFLTHEIDHLFLHIAFIGILSFTSLVLAVFGIEISEKEVFHYKSSHDSLTGLANREYLHNQIDAALGTADTNKKAHALMFIDLDNFKPINDSLGHVAGDRMLNLISQSISRHIRSRDCAARWGGDEFAILLWFCPLARAMHIAELIRKEIADQVLEIDGNNYRVTASIGLIMLSNSKDTTKEAMARVDQACYVAKAKGGNRISFS
ncbi:MAG: hypothetical protein B6D72_03360 [gamma proteobacterium symbiont of Ctena orbiculata]|uniref:Diguanylate cyclase n=1 Tax=Candidatus Thiodiazotropha taylori TaxID=2792791 RepID=A0A944M941_9GAMM|nr:diguanylate cyclase [Candidatus Thiodiazotropha taylori]PUB84914.1 MAG: hypothetical protein DBP00_13855 [gamma proteobacterium symbiont of Ctena orbiculata]MBT2990236.1 diguanylate cyclase [Candidatus Thiodiazotropha taylori]MBT3001755.1 diguanylate cyclase [Candidatus Thiodiazotropha taylori]MBT3028432.1 diguanylate cyclase [Candidatus Thiodiazotropha taylori]